MNTKKRLIILVLCAAMLLTLGACGKVSSTGPEGTHAPTEPTVIETEPKPVFLDVSYAVNADMLETTGVEIHGVTAQVLDETVQYDVEYTAPEGMYLQVMGTELADSWDYLTPGGKDHFVFEIDLLTAGNNLDAISIFFKYNHWDYLEAKLTTAWPEDAMGSLVEMPVTNPGDDRRHVDRATIRAISEDLFHIHVEYTTPVDAQYIVGLAYTESCEDMFYSVGVAPGRDMISILVDRATLESQDSLYVRLFLGEDWEDAIVAQLRSADYALPKAPDPAQTESRTIDGTALAVEPAKGQQLEISSVLVQMSPAGNLYTLKGDFSNLSSATAYCDIRSLYYTSTSRQITQDELMIFVPADILTQTTFMYIECWGNGNNYLGGTDMDFGCAPASAIVRHPEKVEEAILEEDTSGLVPQYLDFGFEDQLVSSHVEIFGITETVLENGNLRYVLEYQASPGMSVTAFDPPNGDRLSITRKQLTSGRRETFEIEVEQAMMDKLDSITYSFWRGNNDGNYWAYIEKNWYKAQVTDGVPVGEVQTVNVRCDRKVTVHNMTAQLLDNGFIRYTMEYTTDAGRRVSFFNQPNNDHFIYLSETLATGGRDTYVVDVPKADNDAVREITMKFYDLSIGDHVYARFQPCSFAQ